MALYKQCKSCDAFLLSKDTQTTVEHASKCFLVNNTQIINESSIKHDPESDQAVPRDELSNPPFRWVRFRNAFIKLAKCVTPEPSKSFPAASTPTRKTKPTPKRKITEDMVLKKNAAKKPRMRYPTASLPGEPFRQKYRYDCDKCPGRFYSKVEFDRHINVHSGTRKLITCIVCLRMFNKRDSINQHYAAHENAEERQEKEDLMNSWPEMKLASSYTRPRQYCKYCLMVHYNQQSFRTHVLSEHEGDKSIFPCRFDDCPLQFSTIRDLLCHAKDRHPERFFGKFTLNRQREVYKYGGKEVKGRRTYHYGPDTENTTADKQKRNKSDKPEKKKKSKPQKRKTVSYCMSSESEDETVNFTQDSSDEEMLLPGKPGHGIPDPLSGGDPDDIVIKNEGADFCTDQEELDPYLLLQIQCNDTDGQGSEFDSKPVVLGMKNEPMI